MSVFSVDEDGKVTLNFHPGQSKAWDSARRFIFVIAGTQGGKTSFGPWWLWREIERCGPGDYIAVTSTFDLFKLKMLPEMRNIFENVLGIGKYHASERILEIRNPDTQEFDAKTSSDPMWARIILRSAVSQGGLESSTAKAAWLDECGQEEFSLETWEAVLRRLSIHRGRVLGTTTPYDLGWLKQEIVDRWDRGDESIDVIQFASVINPLFPKEEFAERRAKMAGWRFDMMYRGQFTRPAGMIYHDFVSGYREDGGHLVRPFKIPDHWPRFVGIDPGGTNVGKIWIAHDPGQNEFYAYRETFSGNMTSKEHVNEVLAFGDTPAKWFVGNKGENQVRLDYKAAGARPIFGPSFVDVELGIDRVIALLKTRRLFFFDTMKTTLLQIGTYARKLDQFDQPTQDIKDKEQYHLLDALRYLIVGLFPKGVDRSVTATSTIQRRRVEMKLYPKLHDRSKEMFKR